MCTFYTFIYICIFKLNFISLDDFDEEIKLALALSAEEAKKPTSFDQGGSRYSFLLFFYPQNVSSMCTLFLKVDDEACVH